MSCTTKQRSPKWFSGSEVMDQLGVGRKALALLVEQGLLTAIVIPGFPAKYSAADVERLAASYTRRSRQAAADDQAVPSDD